MGGVGKTALAVRVAHACQEGFPDGQLYADLGGAGNGFRPPLDVLGSFLWALGVPAWAVPASLDERMQLYRSRIADRRMLVLLDNALSDDQVRPLLPNGAHCRTIITSRAHLATLDGSYVVHLDVLDTPRALALLGRILPPDRLAAERTAAEYIVDYCDRLPLALRVAAGRLAARPQLTLARLAQRLSHERRRLDELQPHDGMGVRDSLQLSYLGLDSATRHVFRQLILLPPVDFPVSAAALILEEREVATEKYLEILVDARLLDVAADQSEEPHYRMLDLVRCFARERAEQEDDADPSSRPRP